jgi:sulfate adenylyltransferase subunit 1 (EFTu-like GTPase family)
MRTQSQVLFDVFSRNRATGSFFLIDLWKIATVAGGMILGEAV